MPPSGATSTAVTRVGRQSPAGRPGRERESAEQEQPLRSDPPRELGNASMIGTSTRAPNAHIMPTRPRSAPRPATWIEMNVITAPMAVQMSVTPTRSVKRPGCRIIRAKPAPGRTGRRDRASRPMARAPIRREQSPRGEAGDEQERDVQDEQRVRAATGQGHAGHQRGDDERGRSPRPAPREALAARTGQLHRPGVGERDQPARADGHERQRRSEADRLLGHGEPRRAELPRSGWRPATADGPRRPDRRARPTPARRGG